MPEQEQPSIYDLLHIIIQCDYHVMWAHVYIRVPLYISLMRDHTSTLLSYCLFLSLLDVERKKDGTHLDLQTEGSWLQHLRSPISCTTPSTASITSTGPTVAMVFCANMCHVQIFFLCKRRGLMGLWLCAIRCLSGQPSPMYSVDIAGVLN